MGVDVARAERYSKGRTGDHTPVETVHDDLCESPRSCPREGELRPSFDSGGLGQMIPSGTLPIKSLRGTRWGNSGPSRQCLTWFRLPSHDQTDLEYPFRFQAIQLSRS